MHAIRVRGARTHNLCDLDVDFEPGQLVAIVGPSGAGKSSLAFATLYAEGQRRFVESVSTYARQFLERLSRPDVDELEPVPAGIAVDRQGEIRTSRSTVASLTDVADYAKSLWAHLACLECTACGGQVRRRHAEGIARRISEQCAGERVLICYAITVEHEEAFLGVRETLASDGYRRLRVGGEVRDLDSVRPSDVLGAAKPKKKREQAAEFEVIVDRLRVEESEQSRLVEAVEAALLRGDGRLRVVREAGERLDFARGFVCDGCGESYPEPSPGLFSFNSPVGACDTCRGFGRVIGIDWEKILDPECSLAGGAVLAWKGKSTEWERSELKKFARAAGVPMDVPVKKLSAAHKRWLREGDGVGYPDGFWGIKGWFKWLESRAYKMHVRVLLSRYRRYDTCPVCSGTRFKPLSLGYKVEGLSVAQFFALSVDDARAFVAPLEPQVLGDSAGELLVREISTRLSTLSDVGLGYLSLDRAGNTLSGGETQRVALSTALGASLSSAMFVLDEPTTGLHPADVERLGRVVRRLADAGNLVLMVEHDPHIIALADRVIELGPGAGERGGRIVFDAHPAQLGKAQTATAKAFAARVPDPSKQRTPRGTLELKGARGNNLRGVDLTIGKGVLTCITGPSGSGKSSLVLETLVPAVQKALGERNAHPLEHDSLTGTAQIPSVVHVDQGPLGRTSRGNPATYMGVWDVLRKRFANTELAKERAYGPAMFSFNVEGGRCEACKGQGYETVEMQFLADVSFDCPECGGKRFVGSVLDVRVAELNVAEMLALSADELLTRMASDREVSRALLPLRDVGLGYLKLGQPLNTLSGGEAQRLKLAQAFSETAPGSLVVLDEPTAGLHPEDIAPLLSQLDRLVERGDTVVVVEHDMRVAARADFVVDLGPGAGAAGGQIVAQGRPLEVAQAQASTSAPFLRAAIAGEAPVVRRAAVKVQKAQGDALQVVHAREHNLKNVSLSIEHGKMVALTGPSGSGKSSLAFGVIHAEAQRRFLETLSPYARQYLPQLPRPNVDSVTSLRPTLSLEQRIARGGTTSTVATVTEVAHYLRLLYARIGVPVRGALARVAKQSAREAARALAQRYGAERELTVFAPVVEGRKGLYRELLDKARDAGIREARIDGRMQKLSAGLALDRYKEHDIDLLIARVAAGQIESTLRDAAKRAEGRVRVLAQGDELLLTLQEGSSAADALLDPRLFSFNTRQGACETCEGKGYIVTQVGRGKKAKETRVPCKACAGTRLSELARSFLVCGEPITHYLAMNVSDAKKAFAALTLSGRDALIGDRLLSELDLRLGFLERVGVGYLGLDRGADTLSGGETQRVRLAAQLGTGLTGVLYVLDEPTIGLHPRDTALLITALRELVSRGNGVLVVEHDLETIAAADHVIDIGPGGGVHGGNVVAQGTPRALMKLDSPTGRALMLEPQRRAPRSLTGVRFLELTGAREHNLRGVNLRIPLGRFSAVTGVSGSGKSTLVRRVLLPAVRDALGLVNEGAQGAFKSLKNAAALKRAVEVDQSPIGRTPRSVPATYLGIWDEIRKLLASTPEARARGYDASRFSFNVAQGRCPTCDGNGVLTVEMSFLPDALLPCDGCSGLRFSRETLEVKYQGLSAGQLLELDVERAAALFKPVRNVHTPLAMMCELGLGYLKLGQPSSTLSGGEAQRMKLVSELAAAAQGPTLYVLDEPTTGLHRSDVQLLLAFLTRFVERGDTVVVIEHHTDVMLAADWLVDLGPEGGAGGGTIVAEGPPEELAQNTASHTAKVLREALKPARREKARAGATPAP